MSVPTITLHGLSSSFTVGRLGYGLMNHTWRPTQNPDEKAFEAIKTSVQGGSNFLNSGEFYGQPDPFLNLNLLRRFYEKFPELKEQTFLSVKGGINLPTFKPDSTEEGLRRSVDNINKLLGADEGGKRMDLFQCARVDKSVPIETVMSTMKKLIAEGKFKFVGLSEVSANTIRKANSVCPISAVEVEYSPWSIDIEKNGVLSTCEELNIPVVAYSPLGKGMLTGQIKSPSDLPEDDRRRHFDRFQPENFENNYKIVESISTLAAKKGVTNTQLVLAYLMNNPIVLPIPGSSRVAGVEECLGVHQVKLTDEELKEIREVVEKADVKGLRYNAQMQDHLEG